MKRQYPTVIGLACCLSGGMAWGGNDGVSAAREDLSRRLSLAPEQIEVVSQQQRSWPNSHMGCRRVGVPVEQVITKGSELVLVARGQTYYYHARPGEPYVYCELPSSKRTGPVEAPIQ